MGDLHHVIISHAQFTCCRLGQNLGLQCNLDCLGLFTHWNYSFLKDREVNIFEEPNKYQAIVISCNFLFIFMWVPTNWSDWACRQHRYISRFITLSTGFLLEIVFAVLCAAVILFLLMGFNWLFEWFAVKFHSSQCQISYVTLYILHFSFSKVAVNIKTILTMSKGEEIIGVFLTLHQFFLQGLQNQVL